MFWRNGGGVDDGGAVAVEFAVIFPVFIFTLLFMLDAGRYLTVQFALNDAAAVGARTVALGQSVSVTANEAQSAVADSVVRLATLDGHDTNTALLAEAYLCPLGSEQNTAVDPQTGDISTAPDGNCINLGDSQNSAISCATAAPNYRAMARVSVTFKWLTPLNLIVQLADANDLGQGSSIFFNRNSEGTTTIEGKAKVLCLN